MISLKHAYRVAVFAVVLLLMGAVGATPSQAAPASTVSKSPKVQTPASPKQPGQIRINASCSRWECDNKNPADMGCDQDASRVASAKVYNQYGAYVADVYLDWSNACQSNWSLVVSRVGPITVDEKVCRDDNRNKSCDDGWDTIYYDHTPGPDYNVYRGYSDMVYAPATNAQACGKAGGGWSCTAWCCEKALRSALPADRSSISRSPAAVMTTKLTPNNLFR